MGAGRSDLLASIASFYNKILFGKIPLFRAPREFASEKV